MCRCTPEIRTPWCGKPGCEMPEQKERTHDISIQSIKYEMHYQRKLALKLGSAYNSLNNKESQYAKGIRRMWNIRIEIIDLLENHLHNPR